MNGPWQPPVATRTTCPYCGVGCGVRATAAADGGFRIEGDEAHPANRGLLCSKGTALADVLGPEERLTSPWIRGQAADWDSATALIARRFSQAIETHGPDSVALYVSGQLLTEDYYVANKLMKGFVGSANIDTNSRLCMASSVAGHRRAFGADIVPGRYEDLEQADLVILTGSNLAWCHPILYRRLAAAREARPEMRVVLIDPRRTATAALADLHLPIAPEGDIALFNGLLAWLSARGCRDEAYVATHTVGLDAALAAAGPADPARTAALAGVAPDLLEQFFTLVAECPRTVTVYSQGVNQSDKGTDKVNAILNVHLMTGRIGRPGMGPLSVTGQPNAMGGREVGGLANQLACHMDLENPEHRALVRDFWQAPRMAERPGLKAVDLFEAAAAGRIRALWIMATNPADSLPDSARVREALRRCPFVVVSDVVARTDTLAHADVVLPAAAWSEKDGMVTNSERRISRQRAFRPPPGEARPDWQALCDVARRMGFAEAFAYLHPHEIFREYAALSAHENRGTRGLDLGAVADIDRQSYEDWQPACWPLPAAGEGRARFFADGGFYTPDRRARFIAVETPSAIVAPRKQGARQGRAGDGFVLNSGRNRDHWHTMTRTGVSARLSRHLAEPYLAMHPDDAARLALEPASLVNVRSRSGQTVLRLLTADAQMPGTVFAPMHWSDQYASAGPVNRLYPAITDPVSGQPRSKAVPVTLTAFPATWYAFALTRERPDTAGLDYWALSRTEGGWRLELAGLGRRPDPDALLAKLCGEAERDRPETPGFRDSRRERAHVARFDGADLRGALFLDRRPVALSRGWAAAWLAQPLADASARWRLLAGRDGDAAADPGAPVCACFGIGENQICRAIREHGCGSLEAVGARLGAGTNCGSCRSEIAMLIERERLDEAV